MAGVGRSVIADWQCFDSPRRSRVYILGINAFHAGASACLIRDGQLVAAAEEERFRRLKYWAGFPALAVRYCLEEAGISAYDLDHVGVARDPRANLPRKMLFPLTRPPGLALIRA